MATEYVSQVPQIRNCKIVGVKESETSVLTTKPLDDAIITVVFQHVKFTYILHFQYKSNQLTKIRRFMYVFYEYYILK